MKMSKDSEPRYQGHTLQEWKELVSNDCLDLETAFLELLQEYFTLKKNEKSVNMILKGLVRGIEKRL